MRNRVHLDGRAVFWRLALIVFAVRQTFVWLMLRRFPIAPGRRLAVFLFARGATQRSLFLAVVLAGALTLLLDLLVQLVLRPSLSHWLSPRCDESSGLFQLAANEWFVESAPARWKQGGTWRAGTLVLTNRRLWFFPLSWDVETWSCALEGIEVARLRPAPWAAWGFLRNWPDLFEVAGEFASEQAFATADPEQVVSWFHPTRSGEETAAADTLTVP